MRLPWLTKHAAKFLFAPLTIPVGYILWLAMAPDPPAVQEGRARRQAARQGYISYEEFKNPELLKKRGMQKKDWDPTLPRAMDQNQPRFPRHPGS